VSDTGTGIEADVIARIFDPFFTTKQHGAGLGLAKVHALIDAHSGSVSCDSTPGRGTTFALRFPAV